MAEHFNWRDARLQMNTASDRCVYYGFVPDFERPTLVFLGSSSALDRFAQLLRSYSMSGEDRALDQTDGFQALRGTQIMLRSVPIASGMKYATNSSGCYFNWYVSRELANRFADLITAVSQSKTPSHHYLEVDSSDDVTVMVSKDEYSVDQLTK